MTVIPHITTTPFVELLGPNEVVLANSTHFTLTHTLDPVLAVDAGLYFCKAVLEIEGLDMPLESQSLIHPLTVKGNVILFTCMSHVLHNLFSLFMPS